MEKITLTANDQNIGEAIDFVNAQLRRFDCPEKISMQIDIAVEEIFVNIAHYAYAPREGEVTIRCRVEGVPLCAVICFEDGGIPYDPLKKKDPDISLSADERDIGGLGIYMVKKCMDEVQYRFASGRNILTIKKFL